MNNRIILIMAFLVLSLTASTIFAQCACSVPTAATYESAAPSYTASYIPTTTYYAPTSYTSYYAPTTTYYASEAVPTTAYYAPAVSYAANYAPVTTYYAPAPYVASYAPTTVYYAPATPYVASYAPTTAYYAPATPYVAYSPVVGTVAVAPREVVGGSIYGTPKVYVRGEPVRNALRSLTP